LEQEVIGTDIAEPFKLENRRCMIQCQDGFWADPHYYEKFKILIPMSEINDINNYEFYADLVGAEAEVQASD